MECLAPKQDIIVITFVIIKDEWNFIFGGTASGEHEGAAREVILKLLLYLPTNLFFIYIHTYTLCFLNSFYLNPFL